MPNSSTEETDFAYSLIYQVYWNNTKSWVSDRVNLLQRGSNVQLDFDFVVSAKTRKNLTGLS